MSAPLLSMNPMNSGRSQAPPTTISRGTFLLWVAHNLERIGDRVTNISERVVFLNTGKFSELSGSWQASESGN